MVTSISVHFNGAVQHSVVLSELAEHHVLRRFNVTASPTVDVVKVLCAGLIQEMLDLRSRPQATDAQKRGASIAITLIEGAQMAAVKAYFAKA